jgi:hypothetical protein
VGADAAAPDDGDHVQFPDVRIEYDGRDGQRLIEDVEVTTPHYRGAHAAAKARGGRGFDPRVAEEILE